MMSGGRDKIACKMVLNEDSFFKSRMIGYLFIGIKIEIEETIPYEETHTKDTSSRRDISAVDRL